ncbi:hypothetical protein HXX76_010286 [Chlamydomonas incerta]|uniref:Uncharacterized protein n=1 Tax=Chlamydomonas incerta TaxID=51695 RepID=A0A835SRR7_CHLIN|nr:hypothetical protein HXX76_010286 [Chlamydomonas incerta]|eukprot:KAG2430187.1 hypothetical protein HXX76_010286 [Chlamydomonas incerta]
MQRVTRSQAKKAQATGSDELASSSFWVPSVQPSPAMQEQPLSGKATGSTVSSGSRHLRPGDWRVAAAAETGGGPVQVPAADFSFTVDNTPNIDDVHSPASSIFTDGAASPALNSCNGTPNALSPLRPRVLATSSVLDGASTRAGTPATQGGTPAMGKDAARGAQSAQGSPASLGGGEVSFTWQSQSAGDDDDVEQPELPQPLSPQSPAAALQRTGSLGELSTPGSGGYNSPMVNVAMEEEQQPPESIMRSSVTHNPLFVDRPTPVPEKDAVVKALSLTPCSNADGNVAAGATAPTPESRGAAAHPAQPPAEPPSPMLPPLDLETPRRSIRGLSAMFSNNTGPTSSAVSGPNAATSNKQQQATPCSGLAPAHAAAAEATPCSAPAPRGSAADVKDAARPDTAAAAASVASSPSASSPRSPRQVDRDDTTGPRNLDQTPRKTGRGSSSKAKEAEVKQASSKRGLSLSTAPASQPAAGSPAAQRGAPAPAVPHAKQQQQRRASPSSTLWNAASWSAMLLCVVLLALSSPFNAPQSSGGAIGLNKLGPVCFPEPYPGAWVEWPAASGVAAPGSVSASAALDVTVDAVQQDLVVADTLSFPSDGVATAQSGPDVEQAVAAPLEMVTDAPAVLEPEPVVEVAEMQQPSAAEGVADELAAETVADSSVAVSEEPVAVEELAIEQQPESAEEPAPAAAPNAAAAEELLSESVEEVEEAEQASPAGVPKAAAADVPAEVGSVVDTPVEATVTADTAAADAQVADVERSSADSSSSTAKQQNPRRFLGWSLPELFVGVVLACATGVALALAVERYGLYPDAQREAAAAAERAVAALQQAPKAVDTTPPAPLPLTPTGRILKLRTPLRAGAPWSNERAEPQTGSDARERDVQRTPAGAFVWKQNRLVYVEDGLE